MDTVKATFGVHTILPSQFFHRLSAGRAQPEKRLAAAVLDDAVQEYRRYANAATRGDRRRLAEVAQWFASDDAMWPFSFHNVCAVLDLNPEWLRRRLWRERKAPRSAVSMPENAPPSPALAAGTCPPPRRRGENAL